jgi:hypothetical protein
MEVNTYMTTILEVAQSAEWPDYEVDNIIGA